MNLLRHRSRIALIAVIGGSLIAFGRPSRATEPNVEVTNVRRVFHNGEHNAFTDLIRFRGMNFLTFRSCPDGHGVSPNASVIILKSPNFQRWELVHRFQVPKRDTRDPHFVVFKDRLFVYTGTWYCEAGPVTDSSQLDLNLHLGFGVSTQDGENWSSPFELNGTFGHYVWRAASFRDKVYLCARRKIGFAVGLHGEPNAVESLMLESQDGINWCQRATFQEIEGDETAFLFDSNGNITAIGRRRRTAQLLKSKPPYDDWQRTPLSEFIGGPLICRWGKRILVGGRRLTSDGPVTQIYWLKDDRLVPVATLPSGGDTSYPGFIATSDRTGVVSWYSSHEKDDQGRIITAIYLADLELAP